MSFWLITSSYTYTTHTNHIPQCHRTKLNSKGCRDRFPNCFPELTMRCSCDQRFPFHSVYSFIINICIEWRRNSHRISNGRISNGILHRNGYDITHIGNGYEMKWIYELRQELWAHYNELKHKTNTIANETQYTHDQWNTNKR